MIKRIRITGISLLLMAAWAGISLAASGVEVSGDLTISNSGKINFPDGSAQTTSVPQVYSNTGEFLGVMMEGYGRVYVPSWKRITQIDTTTGQIEYSTIYYLALDCAGTPYTPSAYIVNTVVRNHFDNNYYTPDRQVTMATYPAYSISDNISACRNLSNATDGCAPCDRSLIPFVQVGAPPFTLPVALPLIND